MSQILKLTAFLLLLTTQAFSKQYYWYIPSFADTLVKVESTIIDSNHVRIGNDIYSMLVEEKDYHLDSQKNFEKNTIYSMGKDGRKLIFKGNVIKVGCSSVYNHATGILKGECREELYDHPTYGNPKRHFHPFDFMKLEKITTCQPDEHFNTQTKQCQKCPEGYSWNPAANRCYKDCTDYNKNKWGGDDGTPQGVCWDCSGSKTLAEVMFCACKKTGSQPFHPDDVKQGIITGLDSKGNGFYTLTCQDGSTFDIKDPTTPDIKDPDKPQDPKDPDTPDKPKPDNNNTKPKPDNPNGPGNNNNPNNPNNPNGPGKDTNNTNPNGPKPGGPSGPGGGGGGDNDGKDKDAKFNEGDFDDGGADKERDGLFGDIKDHINNNLSKFDGISQSITQFMDNVKGKGFDKVKADIKHKCPITREIPLPNGSSKPVTVDYCDIVSPVSEVTYYAFYIGFAVGGFLLFLKLLLLSF